MIRQGNGKALIERRALEIVQLLAKNAAQLKELCFGAHLLAGAAMRHMICWIASPI